MYQIKTKLGEGGQIVIPSEYLQILGLEVGDTVILRLEDCKMRIFMPQKAIRKAQE
jgi:bifunctional DNA-binding transcriptional regulator/antitoxin component of YhaV-PrlF toxin-antitoxin module